MVKSNTNASMFGTPTQEEKDLKIKQQREREKLQKEVESLVAKCMANPDYVKYKEKYCKLERKVMDEMTMLVYDDPNTYAFSMFKLADTLKRLRMLMDLVEADGRRVKNAG